MKLKVFFAILFLAQTVLAQTSSPICQSANPLAYEVLAEMPQGLYAAWWPEFLQTKSGQRWAAIMCSQKPTVIVGGGNCIFDLGDQNSGNYFSSPGVYDGQWTRDLESEPLFTAPNKFNTPKGGLDPGLTFFRHKDVLEKGAQAQAIFHDPVFGNHYHSFGVVSRGVDDKGQRFVIHRAMNDKWGASIRDFKAILDPNGNTLSIAAVAGERNLTNGVGDTEQVRKEPKDSADPKAHYSYYDLPMISPDARFFAVNNRKTMTAQIFEITAQGKRLLTDLGFEAGKLSFAPLKPGSSELKVAFHVDQIDPAEGDKSSSLHKGMTKDIVVMKFQIGKDNQGQVSLTRKEAIRVTASGLLGDGNYYPKWITDHELIFIQSRNQRQSFIKVDVDLLKDHSQRLEAIGASDCANCVKPAYEAVVALGKMYADQCTNFSDKLSAREVQLLSLKLRQESCLSLAQNWEVQKPQLLKSVALYSLRKTKKPGEQRVPGWGFPESYSTRGSERLEKPASRSAMEKLTSADLQAVCQAFKK
ncbi:MAG: hypothetical protein ACAH59_13620 [Pseudobdellovibrionaceae bacterium]